MGLSFQKSETLCMGKTGLSLSVLCRGSFPEKPGRLSETEEIQAMAAARNGAQCVTSDKAQRGQNKWGEWWLFKNMTELVSWLNTDTHPDEFLLTEAFLRHFATNQSVAGRSGFPRGCAAMEIRAPFVLLGKEPLDHAMLLMLPDVLWVIDGDSSSVQLHR